MKVLYVAPHPFFQERGTPIDTHLAVKAISERGDEVDLLTYHEGEDRDYSNFRLFRIRPWIPIRNVRPGPTFKKILCDLHLFFETFKLLRKNKYDLIQACEEAVFIVYFWTFFFRIPFVFDMDSVMATQIVDKFPSLRFLNPVLSFFESLPTKKAIACTPVCNALADEAKRLGARKISIWKDISLLDKDKPLAEVNDLKKELQISNPIMMYIGNLESYQGIDLLIDSFAVASQKADASLVIIGGREEDIKKYQDKTEGLNLQKRCFLIGPKPVDHLQEYMLQADILVCPRISGVNTPQKIFSFLDSGIPCIATDLPTHTQEIDNTVAYLAEPTPEAFGDGMVTLLNDKALQKRLAEKAIEFIQKEHSYSSLRDKVHCLYNEIAQRLNKA